MIKWAYIDRLLMQWQCGAGGAAGQQMYRSRAYMHSRHNTTTLRQFLHTDIAIPVVLVYSKAFEVKLNSRHRRHRDSEAAETPLSLSLNRHFLQFSKINNHWNAIRELNLICIYDLDREIPAFMCIFSATVAGLLWLKLYGNYCWNNTS